MKRIIIFLHIFTLIFLTAACNPKSTDTDDQLLDANAADQDPKYLIWLPPYLPDKMREGIHLPESAALSPDRGTADLELDVAADTQVSEWIFVLAAPFPTITDKILLSDLRDLWTGNGHSEMPVQQILVSGDTKALFEKVWGPASLTNVSVVPQSSLISRTWESGEAWTLIPFEEVEPRWKVIAVDGQSPLNDNFNSDFYPLSLPFSIIGEFEIVEAFYGEIGDGIIERVFPTSNWYADRLTNVMVTGVTALVRGTAHMMETNGMTYPAIDIGDLLRSADILHISNEIPFAERCPSPFINKANEENLIFCSKPEYIQLLESIGTDVVELSGDHFRDWGADAMLNTLSMYEERGWPYYGGGKNKDDAVKPALFEHNGNRIAFLGCNAKPQGYSTAGEDTPGAVHCDMELMADQVKDVVRDNYLPIFTFQHIEYYSYDANKYLVGDFHTAAEAGAVIVSGSQAHMPHAFEFYRDATLHYGLGNLFFDQYYESAAQQEAFIDEHIFYDGKHINTRLITIKFIDLARSRFMDEQERETLQNTVFNASGW